MPLPLASLLDARAFARLQDEQTVRWHEAAEPDTGNGPAAALESDNGRAMLESLMTQLHQANFQLWHAEDEARLPSMQDAATAAAKRTIDRVNQERNDAVEQIDTMLLRALTPVTRAADAEQHSETPGMMIDRMSILSLKLFHTREEMTRAGAPAGHHNRNAERLAILREQRDDLAACLDQVWRQTCLGKRYFKLYRQLKMYNDPELNPVLYTAKAR